MKYIKYAAIDRPKECFICEAIMVKRPEERYVLYRGKYALVLMNLFPYNTGHLLVAPIRHVYSIEDLDDKELLAFIKLTKTSLAVLRKALKPHGFNIGINIGRIAGAGLEDHVHIHIVPRWSGDTNFMPIIANTKVIPEAVADTYKELLKYRELLTDT